MSEFLVLLLLQVTIFSSVTALIIIAVKQIFKCRIPPLIGVVMWVVLLARLLCPVFPESKVSVYNYIPVGRDIMFTLTYDVGEHIEDRGAEYADRVNPYVVRYKNSEDLIPEEQTGEVSASADEETLSIGQCISDVITDEQSASQTAGTAVTVNYIILAVYILGIAAFLGCNIAAYFRAKRIAMISSNTCENEELLQIYFATAEKTGIRPSKIPQLREGISSMLVGCVKPYIICREGTEKREAGMMFAHELNHYKYADNKILLFSTLIACFYWYNPLIWIVRSMLREDIEVLCDSRTLEECGIPGTEYAMMLCRHSAFGELSYSAGCHMSASGRRLKNRLRTISFRKRGSFLPKLASIVLCCLIIMVCLTNPIVSQSSDYSTYIANYSSLTGEDERDMHLQSSVTVSDYLEEIGQIMTSRYGAEKWNTLGGNLEKFKRICASSDLIPSDIIKQIKILKTDEVLTAKSCALISQCYVLLMSGGNLVTDSDEIRLLPKVITKSAMDELLVPLTDAERDAVLSCYNIGVLGADVKFEKIYTEAMMKLILSRIGDSWMREKFAGFYQPIDLDGADTGEEIYSPAMLDILDNLTSGSGTIYVCDPNITTVEENALRKIIGAAFAGEKTNVYYLKEIEDGCPFDTAEFLIKRGGMTYEDMLRGYAEVGELGSVSNVTASYAVIRDPDSLVLRGTAVPTVTIAIRNMYSLGIIDSGSLGYLEIGEKMSCGESLAAAYRLIYSTIEN